MKGIEKYKHELRDYKVWTDSLNVPVGMSAMAALSNSDWDKIRQWNSKLRGMEEILDLTPEEITEIEIEIGIKQS